MGKRSLYDIYFLNYRLFSSNTTNLIYLLNELTKKDDRILTNKREYKNGSIKNYKFDKYNWKKLINNINGSKIENININEMLGFKNDSERRKTEYKNKKYFVIDTILYLYNDDIKNYKEITRIKNEDDGEERFLKMYNKNYLWTDEKAEKHKQKYKKYKSVL